MTRLATYLTASAVLVATAFPAAAINRYNSESLGCGEIRSIIASEGAAILRYPSSRKPSLTLYDRYVQNGSYCASHEVIERVRIPSANANGCMVNHCISGGDCDPGDRSPSCLLR